MRKTIITILMIIFILLAITLPSLAVNNSNNSQQYFFRFLNYRNSAPEKPAKPDGPTGGIFDRVRVGQEKTYTTTTTDPEGNDIAYKWDFDDGTVTEWSQTKPSGAVSWPAEHIWTEVGEYEVKVKAKDDPNGDGSTEDGKESLWSESLNVKVLGKITVGQILISVLQVNSNIFLRQHRIFSK